VSDLGLTDEELVALRSVFRDEASSALEAAAQVLDAGRSLQALDEVMRAAHSIKGSASTVGLDELASIAHRFEDHLGPIRSGSVALAPRLDAILACVDALREVVLASESDSEARAHMREALEMLAASAAGSAQVAAERRRRRPSTLPATDQTRPVLRIEASRVDRMLEDLGALNLDQGRVERAAAHLEHLARELAELRLELRGAMTDPALELRLEHVTTGITAAIESLAGDADALARASDRLRRGLTELRMQSASSLFERLTPQIRAAARDTGKRVRIEISGGDSRFDKAVAEAIADPLVHLVRNAVAHGIEPSSARIAHGKPAEGTITLRAEQHADNFILEVTDDGAGIDPAELRRRLVDTGRWSATKARLAGDEEVLAAIFDAGMTSRESADTLAGRGVGLDAVRATVARLGGEVQVASTPGYGTAFRLRLPLTTAVTQATTIFIGEQPLAVPSAQLVSTIEVSESEISAGTSAGGLPLIEGHQLLGKVRSPGPRPCAVVGYTSPSTRHHQRVGLVCDRIADSAEIVVKGLGPLLGQLPLCAGATTTGSGIVQFILDPMALLRRVYKSPDPVATSPLGETTTTASPAPARILVVDDSKTSRDALATMLDRAGYLVDVAEDGERAWALLETIPYDLLVTDIEMPGMSGLELAARTRRDSRLHEVSIVVVTSRPQPEYRERAEAVGVQGFLTKPVPGPVLLSTVHRCLRQ